MVVEAGISPAPHQPGGCFFWRRGDGFHQVIDHCVRVDSFGFGVERGYDSVPENWSGYVPDVGHGCVNSSV